MLNEQAVSMGPLSDEIIHCETKACTINSELSVRLRDLTMIKVRAVTKVPTSHLLILAQSQWAATCKSTGLCSARVSVQGHDQEQVI